ncbi:hypothetical protein JKF63_06776 [Porcisia hertigi]|uniref:Uncharacterized protein n=1 Tax=Porcisia hertigi TaxID=2761500 RepID=A0A836LEP0_9TRYP|nr:hypothetical protein JKF63_06776 [Porcisia hertigi]
MSSLIRCTDDLLHQKAVQSSHYERLERQLLDGERCRRAAILALRQRAADVKRRGKDVVELRHENQQLSDQLSQHALQLAALQCRNTKAKRRESVAVERLQDGIRTFSGHPARIVLLVQALRTQNELRRAGQRFSRALQLLRGALRIRREALVFVSQSAGVLRSQAILHARLTAALSERTAWCLETHQAAASRLEAATAARVGRVMKEQRLAEQNFLVVDAEAGLLSIYTEVLDDYCGAAKAVVAGLSDAIDTGYAHLSAMNLMLQEKAAAVAEAKRTLTEQQAAHSEASTLHQRQLAQATEEISATAARERFANTRAAELQRLVHCTEKQTEPLARRVYALGFLMSLCEHQQLRLSRQSTTETEERLKAHVELVELRRRHEDRLERLRVAREAAEKTAAQDSLFSREAQGRKSTVDLEGDEWRLLYAQLVRDVCCAKADASAVAAAIARSARRTPAAGGGERGLSGRCSQRKRVRAERSSHITKTAASRRQKAALEAVASLTLTASQHSSIGYHAATHADEGATLADSTAQEHRGGAARAMAHVISTPTPQLRAPSTLRPSYRLTSMKSSAITQKATGAAPAAAEVRSNVSRGKKKASVRAMHVAEHVFDIPVTTAAACASTLSPFTSAVSEEPSDSSLSLVGSRKNPAAGPDAGSSASDVRLSTPSPSPRCPPGRCTVAAPAVAAVRPLPRPLVRQGCGDAHSGAPSHFSDSALTSALFACTPRCITIGGDGGHAPAHPSFPPHFTGSSAALPSAGIRSRVSHTKMSSRTAKSKAVPPPRRRGPLLATPAADFGEDLFADLFS